jgi:hypothetical protein
LKAKLSPNTTQNLSLKYSLKFLQKFSVPLKFVIFTILKLLQKSSPEGGFFKSGLPKKRLDIQAANNTTQWWTALLVSTTDLEKMKENWTFAFQVFEVK